MCTIPFVSCFCSFCVTWLMLLFVMSDVTSGGLREDFDNFNLLDDDITSSSTTFPTYTHPKWFEPYFDPATPRNVTALMGKSAYLSCRVRNLGNKTVSWIRHRDIHILTVGSYTYTSDQRFQATHHPDSDDWTLQIKWAQKRDAGMYECQISTQPVRSYFIRLNVVVPTATILGGPDLHVDKGSTINLTCTVKFSPEPPAYIFWYHHEEVINYDSTRGGVSVITEKGDVTTSFLLIQNADLVDSGKYSCAPSNADVASVRVHVLNGEHPEAMQTGSSGCQYSWLTIVLLMSLVFCYHQHNMTLNAEMNILNTTAATATVTATPSTIRATRTQANSSNFLNSNIYKNNVGKQKTSQQQQQQQEQCILRLTLYNNKMITTRITTKTTVNPSIITSLHIHRNCCHCNYEQQQQQQQQQQQHYSHLQYCQKNNNINNSNEWHESSRHQSHQLQPLVVSVTNYCYSESNRCRCHCRCFCCCYCVCSYYYYCCCNYGGILWQKQSAHSVYHNVRDEKFLAVR